jgi:hypothetical protein
MAKKGGEGVEVLVFAGSEGWLVGCGCVRMGRRGGGTCLRIR